MTKVNIKSGVVLLSIAASLSLVVRVAAVQSGDLEGAARGFPVLRDSAGKKLADGNFVQWLEDGRLHVRITYQFGRNRSIQEHAILRQKPRLIQEEWSWRELRDDKLYSHFQVNFRSGSATAKKLEDNNLKEWSEKIEVKPGRTFAGFGFTLALKAFRERLIKGERVELEAVGFTPKPRVVSVEVSHGGLDQIRMGDRIVRGDRFVIHPKIPWIADLFVDVPDTYIWLTNPAPAIFLRWEGPLAEPKDPVIRVDLLPGRESGPAEPVGTRVRR